MDDGTETHADLLFLSHNFLLHLLYMLPNYETPYRYKSPAYTEDLQEPGIIENKLGLVFCGIPRT